MLRFLTLVSLLVLSNGFEKSAKLQEWLRDAKPFNTSISDKSRIVGGQTTTINNHPWTVSLQHEWEEYQYDKIHFCTGGIINKDWIVTSAECALLIEDSTNYTARVGSSYFHRNGSVHRIEEVVIHPQFNENSDDYDIALLRLNTSLVFSNVVQSLSLPKVNATVAEGTELTLASWGSSYFLGDMTTELQEITMPTIGKEICSTAWGERLTDRMFCTYRESEGICIGDTGTPAIVDGVLVGISSFHYACSASGYPAVFTDVSLFVDWISETSGSQQTVIISFYSLLASVAVLVKIIL